MTVASPGPLPGNLLSPADSEFETALTGNWGALTNCSLALASTQVFTGTRSLKVTATANGTVQFFVGNLTKFPVSPLDGYVASYAIRTPNSGRSAQTSAWWYTSGGAFISFPSGATRNLPAGSWAPMADAFTSPATAGLGQMFITITGMLAGETAQVDLVYVAKSSVQILCDWTNPPFSPASVAGSAFFDLTPWVSLAKGADWSRGRQDGVNSVPAGSASFTAYNTHGWFTQGDSASPWYPNVKLGRRVQINVADETGVWHTRFDGPISEIDYEYDDVGNCDALIACSDVLAFLGRDNKLSCWTKEQVLLDGPALHWSLDEASGLVAYESSGNNGPVLRMRQYGSGATAATFQFASGSGGVETQANAPSATKLGDSPSPLPSAYFTTKQIHTFGLAQSSSAQLSGAIPAMSTRTGNDFSVETWATLDPGAFSTLYNAATDNLLCLFSLGDTRTGKNFTFSLFPDGPYIPAAPAWRMQTWGFPLSDFPYLPSPPTNPAPIAQTDVATGTLPDGGVPIHFVAKVVGNDAGATLTMYVNGASIGTIALPKYFTPNWLDLGGLYGGFGGWQGNITLASIYNRALDNATIANHASIGTAGMYLSTTSAGAIAAAAFAGIPPFWSNLAAATSLGIADYVDLTGASVLSTMQTFEQAEVAGLLYVNAAGKVCFDGREIRLGASAPDLTLPAGSYSADLGYKVSDQYLVTEAAVNTPVTSRAATVMNPSAELDYGPYTSGTSASPNSVPVLSQNPIFTLRGVPAYSTQLDPYVTDVASWQAFRASTPPFKATSITVDVVTLQDPTSGAYVALSALYGVDINNVISLGGSVTAFPSDFGALDMFIEGVTEHIDMDSHTIGFYTSPANLVRCWKPGDATYGVLDSTAIIGVSNKMTHANGPRSKTHAADPGPPFWPPAYAATMNNGGVSGKGFVGATDQRGIWHTLQSVVQQPPLLIAGQTANQQSFSSGTTEQTMAWDMTYVDTVGGMGIVPGFPNFYCVLVPGFYAIECVIVWVANANGNRFARLVINPNGASGSPTGSDALSVAGTSRAPIAGTPAGVTLQTRLYCGIGTTIGVRCWQDSGGSLNTGTATANGSTLSIQLTGYSTSAD